MHYHRFLVAKQIFICLMLECCRVQVEAIVRHESQKDRPLFPGADDREFWQRAGDRNKVTVIPLFAVARQSVYSYYSRSGMGITLNAYMCIAGNCRALQQTGAPRV